MQIAIPSWSYKVKLYHLALKGCAVLRSGHTNKDLTDRPRCIGEVVYNVNDNCPFEAFCARLGLNPLPCCPPFISSHTSLQISEDKRMFAGLLWPDANRPRTPLASGPDREREKPLEALWRSFGEDGMDGCTDGGGREQTGLRQVLKYSAWLFWWQSLCKNTAVCQLAVTFCVKQPTRYPHFHTKQLLHYIYSD